jgi:hypothetical protein
MDSRMTFKLEMTMIEIMKRCVCDICGAEGPLALESEAARDVAQGEGWVCGDDDTCPRCAAKEKTSV